MVGKDGQQEEEGEKRVFPIGLLNIHRINNFKLSMFVSVFISTVFVFRTIRLEYS